MNEVALGFAANVKCAPANTALLPPGTIRYDETAMRFCYSLVLTGLALACVPLLTSHAATRDGVSLKALDLDAPLALDNLATQLASKRVVFVGEIHTRYDNHLNQLEIIRRLHEVHPNLAIGVEYFPKQLQPQVDAYIEGKSTEDQFLRATDYYRVWGYDYRLYAPIFRFAREQRIPVLALNVPESLPSKVAGVGLAGLTKQERASLPAEIPPADAAYQTRLRSIFEEHAMGKAGPGAFNHFVEAQTVWDESMAANAADYLKANPDRPMVILAGAGHLEYGSGIPSRLERRTHATYAIVLSSGEEIEPQIADYIVLSKTEELPPAGALGVSLKAEHGECRIGALSPTGAAEQAGIRRGDVLVAVDDQPVKATADVHLALWDKKPGDRVRVSVSRKRRFGGAVRRDFEIVLSGPQAVPSH
jgi:uncharacterized iron-regulated protein